MVLLAVVALRMPGGHQDLQCRSVISEFTNVMTDTTTHGTAVEEWPALKCCVPSLLCCHSPRGGHTHSLRWFWKKQGRVSVAVRGTTDKFILFYLFTEVRKFLSPSCPCTIASCTLCMYDSLCSSCRVIFFKYTYCKVIIVMYTYWFFTMRKYSCM